MRTLTSALLLLLSLAVAVPAFAGDVEGRITDRTGGSLPGASVQLLNVATGDETNLTADKDGRYRFEGLRVGIYRLAIRLTGFSDASRTVIVDEAGKTVGEDFTLDLGSMRAEVTVSADRGERDAQLAALRTDTVTQETLRELAPVSTGDALVAAPGVTPVGSGPFQNRPRLRGLDSTRVLVLVDGERLNNARTATDRAGVEVGLVDTASIEDIEVLGGAGSVLYGTDALSGTINIITNRPRLSDSPLLTAGFDGFYSSNESGRRGTVTLGLSNRRYAALFTAGTERFDDYTAGKKFQETSVPFFTSGRIRQADTIDDNFGFSFKAFPDPFNTPFTRTTALIPSSGMEGSSANLAFLGKLSASQSLEVKWQRRRATNVGFPDFADPFFFQSISLPFSNLDKISASYAVTTPTSWLARLSVRPYFQRQDRLLRNRLPVQFPAPTAVTFFPISVFRLNITSDTRQQVWTPGVDVQAVFQTRPNNVLTAGVTWFRDRSEDQRTTTTETTIIGQVALGSRGPAATVFNSPLVMGSPTVANPTRVPNASFSDAALFLHDEWHSDAIRITTGIRLDGYRVKTDATPGYDIASVIAGTTPAINPATLPSVNGDTITRKAFTGEAGVVLWSEKPVSLFSHYVRSYRHPNLEELLFAGPATAGSIAPNVTVKPETGHNVDVGARVRLSHVTGSVAYFNNTYRDFISTEVTALTNTSSGPSSVSQAINLARVRIQGVEAEANAPFVAGPVNVLPNVTVAYNRGTVLSGQSPLSSVSLAGKPQDNITPLKVGASVRLSDRRERWWGSYSVRTQSDVTRVSPLLSDSSFLIAQDLLALGGFAIQRVAAGYDWRRGSQVLGLTVAVENLTDVFYREQFQFAPARGRSVSVSLHVRGVR